MKTNYHPRSKTKYLKIQKALLALAVFLVVALFFSSIHFPLASFFEPIWKSESAVSQSLRNTVSILRSKTELIRANRELEEKIRSYEIEQITFANWQEREQELLTLLERQKENPGVAAAVLTHPSQNPYDMLLVDVGSNQRVRHGDKAKLPEGPLLGAVTEVFANTAKVRLFSSVGERTNAVLERGSVPVKIIGNGGGTFKLSLPRDVAVEIGDKIFSPGLKPRLVAVVGDISMKPTDSLKEVLLKSPANIFSLRFIILSQ
ncbi:MAG: rod shape-determining protein MreC [Patescibacteria group bacterium]|mgnify:CR=1 FL=1